LDPNLRKLLKAEHIESYVDAQTSYTHLALHTHTQMRVSTIQNFIYRHNLQMVSERLKIILRKPSAVEDSIMVFSRNYGECLNDCAYFRRIHQAKERGSDYHYWPRTDEDHAECHANKEAAKKLKAAAPPPPEAAASPKDRKKRMPTVRFIASPAKERRLLCANNSEGPRRRADTPPPRVAAAAPPPRAAADAMPTVLSIEPFEMRDDRFDELADRCSGLETQLRGMESRLFEIVDRRLAAVADFKRLVAELVDERFGAIEARLDRADADAIIEEAGRQKLEEAGRQKLEEAVRAGEAGRQKLEEAVRAGEAGRQKLEEAVRAGAVARAGAEERLWRLEKELKSVMSEQVDSGERLDSLDNFSEETNRRLDSLEGSSAYDDLSARVGSLETTAADGVERLGRLERARAAAEGRLEGALAVAAASAAREEACKTREEANAARIAEFERRLSEGLERVERDAHSRHDAVLNSMHNSALSLRLEVAGQIGERVARLEEAAAGQRDMRFVVSDALRAFHDTYMQGKADLSALGMRVMQLEVAGRGDADAMRALGMRVMQLEVAGRGDADAMRARVTELERENAALEGAGAASERLPRSEAMDFRICRGEMPAISRGLGSALSP